MCNKIWLGALILVLLAIGGLPYDSGKTSQKGIVETITGYSSGVDNREYRPPTESSSASTRVNDYKYLDNKSPSQNEEINVNRLSAGNPSRHYNRSYYPLGIYKITAYTAGYESTGKSVGDEDYGRTATGKYVTATTAAADWKVLRPGTRIFIEGVGYRIIEDKGGAVIGRHIDVYVQSEKAAMEFGVQHHEVYLVEGD